MLHHFDLHLSTEPDGTAVVAVDGELDLASAAQFREAIGEAMGTGARSVVVDLGKSDFVDSSGIGALLWAERRLEALGGALTAVNCTPQVRRVFELSGLAGFLH